MTRRSRLRWCSALACALLCLATWVPGCARQRGQVIVALYTDLPSPAFASSLRIDVYKESQVNNAWNGLTWVDSQSFFLDGPERFPATFGLALDDGSDAQDYLVRVRLGPSGSLRDYRGERFMPPVRLEDGAPDDIIEEPQPTVGALPRLVLAGTDVTPEQEPDPALHVDRIARVRVDAGKRTRVDMHVHGACIGDQADLAVRQSCLQTEHELGPLKPLASEGVHPKPGAWPSPTDLGDCSAIASAPEAALGAPADLERQTCVPGGLFVFGGTAPDEFLVPKDAVGGDHVRKRVAVVRAFMVDRYEYTVGRWRSSGISVPQDVILNNEEPLIADDTSRACTAGNVQRRENYPLNCLTRPLAQRLCGASAGRLLTDTEWLYLASNVYAGRPTLRPWGDDPLIVCSGTWLEHNSAQFANFCGEPVGPGAETVFDAPEAAAAGNVDRNLLGIMHLLGNVSEMVDAAERTDSRCFMAAPRTDLTCGRGTTGPLGLRGQSWNYSVASLGFRVRLTKPRDEVRTTIGFRCARSLP
jgi:formylglycine-generating enzyme required for sulfatase activity